MSVAEYGNGIATQNVPAALKAQRFGVRDWALASRQAAIERDKVQAGVDAAASRTEDQSEYEC